MRLGVSLTTATPIGFYSQRFCSFLFPCWNPGLCGLSHSPVVLPGLSACKCGNTNHCLACPVLQPLPCCTSSPPWLPISTPPTSLGECFFFNSLVVRLPYSSTFCQIWLFFIFKFVVVLILVVQRGKVYLPTPPSWPEVLIGYF